MNKIINYEILERLNKSALTNAVSNYIDLGWQPYGPLNTPLDPETEDIWYLQAMVMYEE